MVLAIFCISSTSNSSNRHISIDWVKYLFNKCNEKGKQTSCLLVFAIHYMATICLTPKLSYRSIKLDIKRKNKAGHA